MLRFTQRTPRDSTYKPFNIGNRFRIVPFATPVSMDQRIDLIMQRGAFGSGEHETTENCLETLETLDELQGMRVLDLGSGTGILAIAAVKLGAASALCVDIEAQAVATAKVNCQLNGLEKQISHLVGTLDDVDQTTFDLILANIYGDILLAIAVPLAARLAPGGTLLLSGILWEYNFDIRQRYEKLGCELLRNRFLEDFSTVLLVKKP
jgi:ribosomal protein L11 methyltransferase